MRRTYIFISFIIIFAAFLRFWNLGENPPSLSWDEAAWGYNAYSLGIDGKDEFGKFLPISYIESFGDFKPPLYAYVSIIPVKLFGLNEFGVRFASAFFGVLTVLFTYFLAKEIFAVNPKSQILNSQQFQISNFKFQIKEVEIIALLAAFVLAISPWHILLSRAAFEANVATFFIVLGVLLFLVATRDAASVTPQGWFRFAPAALTLSIVSFVLSMYTFNTARIVAPFLLLGLIVAKRHSLFRAKTQFFTACLIGFLIFLPLGLFLSTPQAQLRFKEVNIFSDSTTVERASQQIQNDNNAWWSKIIHNRRAAYATEYLHHYFDNLNPLFLFIRGDGNPKFSIQDVGQMYIWEMPFFIAGALLLFRRREGEWWLIPYWLIVGIIPAATARETPHALRIESTLPTFQILTAIGLGKFLFWIRNAKILNNFKFLIVIFIFSLLIFNFLYFYHNYFVHYTREFSGEWQYGYKEAISYIGKVENSYDTIYFTESLGRPYIYFLFYKQYSPDLFRKEAKVDREVYGFVHVRGFAKYRFAKDVNVLPRLGKNILFVDTPSKIPHGAKIEKTFYLLNGTPVLVAYTL